MGFQRVKQILNQAVAKWEENRGKEEPADLSSHGASFGWITKGDLLTAAGFGKRLVQPEVIGNGKGDTANLVVVLKKGLPFRMPRGGPFVPDDQIQEIEDWINEGCPD